MALSLVQYLFSCILLFALFSNAQRPSPFEFLRNLEGSQKGDKPQGLDQLKRFLSKFGYINSNIQNPNIQILESNNNYHEEIFDEALEAAIKTYQLNYHLKPTGILDSRTVESMMTPRCGVADINNGRSRMRAAQKRPHHDHYTVSHYELFDGSPKWPKPDLTYKIDGSISKPEYANAISRAFDKWAAATNYFKFTRVDTKADITLLFASKDHGDGYAFDGAFGVLAHATPPTQGTLHFDADESWAVGPVDGKIDIETVALHELGHVLGLDHSSVEAAVMFPSVGGGECKSLHGDDIQGVKALYKLP